MGSEADHILWHVRKAVLIRAHGRAASPLMRRACSPSHRRRLTRWQDRSRNSWSLEDPILFTTSASPTSCAVRRRNPHGQIRQLSASRVCRGHGGSCASPCRTLADATLDTPREATAVMPTPANKHEGGGGEHQLRTYGRWRHGDSCVWRVPCVLPYGLAVEEGPPAPPRRVHLVQQRIEDHAHHRLLQHNTERRIEAL